MILNIIPPASMLAALGAEPGDRLLVDDAGLWCLYQPRRFNGAPHPGIIKRILDDAEVEALRVTPDDIAALPGFEPTPARRTFALFWGQKFKADAESWLGLGIARPDFLRWTSRGIFEPSVAADLFVSGCDPDLQRDLLGEHSEALNDGDMSVAEFMGLVNRE